MITIERGWVDHRWCVASSYRETLCLEWLIPLVFGWTVLCLPLDWWRSRRYRLPPRR